MASEQQPASSRRSRSEHREDDYAEVVRSLRNISGRAAHDATVELCLRPYRPQSAAELISANYALNNSRGAQHAHSYLADIIISIHLDARDDELTHDVGAWLSSWPAVQEGEEATRATLRQAFFDIIAQFERSAEVPVSDDASQLGPANPVAGVEVGKVEEEEEEDEEESEGEDMSLYRTRPDNPIDREILAFNHIDYINRRTRYIPSYDPEARFPQAGQSTGDTTTPESNLAVKDEPAVAETQAPATCSSDVK